MAQGRPASLASFQVNPVVVTLSPDDRSEDVVIANHSPDDIRLSLALYAWTQSPSQPLDLRISDELVFFPQVFTVAAGAVQRVRIGSTRPASPASEIAYRLYISELPAFARNRINGVHLSMLTRVGIPIFLPPSGRPQPLPSIGPIRIDGRHATVVLSNAGDLHVPPSKAEARAYDAGGRRIWRADAAPWYVLAHRQIALDLDIPATLCPAVTRLEIVWHTSHGDPTAGAPRGGKCR